MRLGTGLVPVDSGCHVADGLPESGLERGVLGITIRQRLTAMVSHHNSL